MRAASRELVARDFRVGVGVERRHHRRRRRAVELPGARGAPQLARGELAAVIAIELVEERASEVELVLLDGRRRGADGLGRRRAPLRVGRRGGGGADLRVRGAAALRERAAHEHGPRAAEIARGHEPRVAEQLHLLERAQRAAEARALSGFEVRGASERDGRLRAPAHDARKRAVHEERDGREAEEDGRGVAAEAQAEVRSAVDGVAAAPHPTRGEIHKNRQVQDRFQRILTRTLALLVYLWLVLTTEPP